MKQFNGCFCVLLLSASMLVGGLPASHAATILITDFADVDFGELPPTTGEVTQRLRICVSSRPPGPYQITALGLNATGSFALINETPQMIPFTVYAARRRNRLGRELLPGVPAQGFSARRLRRNGNCRPPWLWLTIVVEEDALDQVPGGRYWGTLQLTVAPE